MIAVWFSCGAASAVAAKVTLEKYPDDEVRIVNNPVAEEHHDNRRFLQDVQEWLGHPIETAINPKYDHCSAREVWARRKYMSGTAGAPCTVELKKRARQAWEAEHHPDWHVLGFTLEEAKRVERFMLGESDKLLPVLVDERITKADPNANCIGCVKATSPTYWNHVRRMHPAVFEDRAKQSREMGVRLVRVNNKRIFLDELDPAHEGAPMKTMQVECGIFCEET